MALTVVYDACVLYPAPLRDLLMHLALTDLISARWTDRIHEEWITSLLADRPDLTRDQLERTRSMMNAHVRDCLVEGYDALIDGLTLPDPDDRHVLAAAVRAGASVIVTFNLKDFPDDTLSPYAVEARHPDDFVSELLVEAPDVVCAAAKRQRESLKRPPKSVQEYLDILLRIGLPQTVFNFYSYSDAI
jgi:hypothetical protein